MESNQLKLEVGKKITRQEVIQTLVVEGGISFMNVEKMEDISDETLLSACVQVIDMLAEQKEKLLDEIHFVFSDQTRQFYRAAQCANIRVCREDNKIKLEVVK